jgi:hypothetical protein
MSKTTLSKSSYMSDFMRNIGDARASRNIIVQSNDASPGFRIP